MAWNRICCAIDFSEPSRLAMLEAADLARRFESELTLLHVYEPPSPQSAEMPPELLEDEPRDVDASMERWRAEANRVAGRAVNSTVLSGKPAAEIVQYARARGFDLLVVGTHGRTGLGHVLLGSVAERVVREASCPVLVQRRPAT